MKYVTFVDIYNFVLAPPINTMDCQSIRRRAHQLQHQFMLFEGGGWRQSCLRCRWKRRQHDVIISKRSTPTQFLPERWALCLPAADFVECWHVTQHVCTAFGATSKPRQSTELLLIYRSILSPTQIWNPENLWSIFLNLSFRFTTFEDVGRQPIVRFVTVSSTATIDTKTFERTCPLTSSNRSRWMWRRMEHQL